MTATLDQKTVGRARRGLTYVELTIGMAITAVLMLALASFAVAVSTGWKHSEEEFKVRSASNHSVRRLEEALSNMLCIVQINVGNAVGGQAYFFCWQQDTWGGTADLKAQFGEMALIEYDPSTKAVWLYQIKDAATMTNAEKTSAAQESWGDYSSASIVTFFKASSLVGPRRPLVGGYGEAANGGITVASAQLGSFAANNGKPLASYQLVLNDGGASTVAYGNVALRAAQTPTNLHGNAGIR